MIRVLLLIFALFAIVFAHRDFDSSNDEDCDDDSGNDDNRRCPSGWKLFRRRRGTWCMRVIPAYGITNSAAANVCGNNGGVLSGVENTDEWTWIINSAKQSLSARTGSLWIGASRTANCLGRKLSATCSQTTAFQWTDSSTSGIDGFKWLGASLPDNALGGNQNCMLMFYASDNTIINRVSWFPGSMDDVNCDDTGANEPRRVQGCVCGRKPSN